jgi:hypothetical protein
MAGSGASAVTEEPAPLASKYLAPTLAIIGVAGTAIVIAVAVGLMDKMVPAVATPAGIDGRRLVVGVWTLSGLAIALLWRGGNRYLAAMWVVSPRVPAILAISWLVLYLPLGRNGAETLGVGVWITGLAWLLLSAPVVGWASGGNRRAREFGDLATRLNQLTIRHDRIRALLPTSDDEANDALAQARDLGLHEARNQLRLVEDLLAEKPPKTEPGGIARGASPYEWVSGAAYINGRMALHRAEEALIDAEPLSAVIGDALHDALRISSSTMDHDNAMRDSLRAAVRELDPRIESLYFDSIRGRADDPPPKRSTDACAEDDAAARAVVREVRFAVNDFRDTRIHALFRVRGRIFRTILVCGLVIDLLVGLAILLNVKPEQLAAAATFFLVGAIIGLFNRLRLEVTPDRGVEQDFGLFDARLLQTVLLSGVAGVGGVVLAAAAPVALGQAATTTLDLAKTFSLQNNPQGVLVAAAFGLTPEAIIGGLRAQTDALKKDLSSSEPAAAAPQVA